MPPGPYRAMNYRKRELTLDHIHILLTTQGHGGPPHMRDHLNAGATSETTQTCKMIHTIDAPIHSYKADMKGCLWWPDDIRGSCGPKASWHLSYRWGKTPKKIIQETCPDRGSNLGPLCDRRAYYHLAHSGGQLFKFKWYVGGYYRNVYSKKIFCFWFAFGNCCFNYVRHQFFLTKSLFLLHIRGELMLRKFWTHKFWVTMQVSVFLECSRN